MIIFLGKISKLSTFKKISFPWNWKKIATSFLRNARMEERTNITHHRRQYGCVRVGKLRRSWASAQQMARLFHSLVTGYFDGLIVCICTFLFNSGLIFLSFFVWFSKSIESKGKQNLFDSSLFCFDFLFYRASYRWTALDSQIERVRFSLFLSAFAWV